MDVPTSQMSIFILSLSAGVLFEGAFSLLVSLTFVDLQDFLVIHLTYLLRHFFLLIITIGYQF